MMRGIGIGAAIDGIAQTFISHHAALLHGDFQGKDLIEQSPAAVHEALQNAKTLARERIFRHRVKVELAAFSCIASMLDLLVPAAHALIISGNCKKQHKLALSLLENDPITERDSLYLAYMKILDFIGGMTDNYAARIAQEISGISMV